jgi:1-acyl-sn-glycerol-3-phosphate acyltransferase
VFLPMKIPGRARAGTAATRGGRGGKDDQLPGFAPGIYRWFIWYVQRYLRRHFHALRVLRSDEAAPVPVLDGQPAIFFTNHPGWWDPLIFLAAAERLYPGRLNYGPIDAAALGKYRFLERIGFIGIEPGTWRGSARFLRMARAALERDDVIFWITAHGEFVDPRARPVAIRPGVGHAAASARRGVAVPVAVEYPFWNERLPEALVAFGPTIRLGEDAGQSASVWTVRLEEALALVQDRLAAAAIERDPRRFVTLLEGRRGVGPVYDAYRRLNAWLRGQRFNPAHGDDEPAGRGMA